MATTSAAVEPSTTMMVPAFTVRELTGRQRRLVLVSRALPYRPFTLTGDQRAELTWYPGSPVATVQFLGASEGETTITGIWKDRFIKQTDEEIFFPTDGADEFIANEPASAFGVETQPPAQLDGSPVRSVNDLVRTVDEMRREGQLVEVSWFTVVRHGVLKNFTQTWHTSKDCEWSMTFAWVSQGLLDLNVLAATKEADLSEMAASFEKDLATLTEEVVGPIARAAEIGAEIDLKITRLQDSLKDVNESLENFVSGALAPLDASRRAVGIFEFAAQEADTLINFLYSVVDAAGLTIPIGEVTTGQMVAIAKTNRDTVRASRRTKHNATRNKIKLTKAIEPDLIASFFAKEGQDLRDVALQVFGNADEWRSIAKFNGLKSSKLRAGQVVLVARTQKRSEC